MKPFRAFVLVAGGCSVLSQFATPLFASDPQKQQPPQAKLTLPKAATTDSKPSFNPKSSWELRGVAVDESDAPVAHARVTVHAFQFEQGVQTAADGSFALTVAGQPNVYRLVRARDKTGSLQGFVRSDPSVNQQPKLIRVVPTPIRLVLKKPQEMAVAVTDKSTKPVEHATVIALSQSVVLDQQKTDSAGKASLRVPAGLPLQYVVAMKADLGLDYVNNTQLTRRGGNSNQPSEKDDPLKFVLGGATTVNVHVSDPQGKPVAGAHVNPRYFTLLKKATLYLWDEDVFAQVTDAQGNATFRFIPSNEQNKVMFHVGLAEHVVLDSPMFDPRSKSRDLSAVLFPLERVRGKVITAEGRPAVAAEIQVNGSGFDMDDFHGTAKCDNRGEFELRVPPNKYYTFSARRDRTLAAVQNRTVLAGVPVEPLTFLLKIGTRIFGRVTRAKDQTPAAQTFVGLQLKSENSYHKLPKNQQLPNPKESRKWIGPHLSENTETDAAGRFEFFVAPGHYHVQLNGAWDQRPPTIEVQDQDEIEVNLADKRPERSVLRGRVVLKSDPTRGVPEAVVQAASTDSAPGFNDFRTVADREGRFEFTRPQINMLVRAGEGTLAGAVRIAPGDQTVIIPLTATASATGKFVDSQTGLPAANRRVDCGVQLPEKGGPFSWYFGGSATSDADGRFTIKGLTAGLKYTFEAVIDQNAEGPQGWQRVAVATPKEGERVDLGELKYPASRPRIAR